MTELLAQILDLSMSNNGFCNTISHQMACVNIEFYHINIKKNNNAYLKRTEELQYISDRLLYFERLKISQKYCIFSDENLIDLGEGLEYLLPIAITEDIALTLYCFDTYSDKYWHEYEDFWNDEIDTVVSFSKDYIKMFYLKKDNFHKDFVFDFSLDLWKKFKKNLVTDASSSMETFIFSLSSSFKKYYKYTETKHNVAEIFISMRWNSYEIGTEYKQGQNFTRKLLKYMKKDMFIQDYNILLTTKPTMPELIQLHDEVNEKNEDHKYFTIFMLERWTPYFAQQLIFDIIQNSSIKKNKRIKRWIRGFLSGLID